MKIAPGRDRWWLVVAAGLAEVTVDRRQRDVDDAQVDRRHEDG